MPKKTKNRSNKQAKKRNQDKAREARQEQLYDAIENASVEAFPTSLATGQFEVLTGDGPRTVTLGQMCQSLDADMADDGEPPMDLDELTRLLEDDVHMRQIYLAPDGLWRFPEMYVPKGERS